MTSHYSRSASAFTQTCHLLASTAKLVREVCLSRHQTCSQQCRMSSVQNMSIFCYLTLGSLSSDLMTLQKACTVFSVDRNLRPSSVRPQTPTSTCPSTGCLGCNQRVESGTVVDHLLLFLLCKSLTQLDL